MAGSYQGFGSQQSQPMQYQGWGNSLPYTGVRQFNPGYNGGGINPSGGVGGPMTGGQQNYPSVPKPMGGYQSPMNPGTGFTPGQQIGQGMPGQGGGFGPFPPMQPGGYDPIAAQNARMGGAGNVNVDPNLARMRVQQGVLGGGGYSMQDMADAGMGSQDLNTMIQGFRSGNLGPVDMTAQQAQGLQQASALRNRNSAWGQGVQNLMQNLPGFLAR